MPVESLSYESRRRLEVVQRLEHSDQGSDLQGGTKASRLGIGVDAS